MNTIELSLLERLAKYWTGNKREFESNLWLSCLKSACLITKLKTDIMYIYIILQTNINVHTIFLSLKKNSAKKQVFFVKGNPS